jgi:hypothetical protein
MPTSRGRKRARKTPNPDKVQSSPVVQTTSEDRPFLILLRRGAYWSRHLAASLLVSLGWLWTNHKTALFWLSALVGLLAGGLALLPRVTVEPSGPYDPSNPSPITFTIANVNIVPLRDVQPILGICNISNRDEPLPQCNGPAVGGIRPRQLRVKWLDTDEKYQIALEEILKLPGSQQFPSADITIAVEYTPWRMPWFWRNRKEYRFVTKKRSDGKIYWVPIPLNR